MRMRRAIARILLLVLMLAAVSGPLSGCRQPKTAGGETTPPKDPVIVAPSIAVTPESQAVARSTRLRIWTVPGPDNTYAWLEYEGQESPITILASGHVTAGTARIDVPAQVLPFWFRGCQPIVWLDDTRVLFFGHILADTATGAVRALPVGCDIIDSYQLSPDRQRLALYGTLSDEAGGHGVMVYDFATGRASLAKKVDLAEFGNDDAVMKMLTWLDAQTLLFDHPSQGQPAIWEWSVSGRKASVWKTGVYNPRARGDGRYVLFSYYPTDESPAPRPALADLTTGTESVAPDQFWPLFDAASDIVGGPATGDHADELMRVGHVQDGRIVVSKTVDRHNALIAFGVSPRGVTYSILHYDPDSSYTIATYATQTTLAPSSLPPGGPEDAKKYTFYDNGTMRSLSGLAIKQLVEDVAGDTRFRLGPDWDQRPAYAARYFTMNLLGIVDQRAEAWGQCASAGGNAIGSGDGAYLGDYYAGQLDVDRTSEAASVRVRTAGKKAYVISLSRPWPGGPWLVTKVEETAYVSPP